ASTLLSRYDEARARRDRRELRRLDEDALWLMDRGLDEGRREMHQARAEVAHSASEMERSRDELRHTGDPVVRADERRDRRADGGDRRDAVRDARAAALDRSRVRALRSDYAALAGRLDPRATGRKRDLLAEFVRQSHRELREDRHELREDRRERR